MVLWLYTPIDDAGLPVELSRYSTGQVGWFRLRNVAISGPVNRDEYASSLVVCATDRANCIRREAFEGPGRWPGTALWLSHPLISELDNGAHPRERFSLPDVLITERL